MGFFLQFLEVTKHCYLFIFIEFIGVTLGNKIIQVSGSRFYNTPSVHCMCVHHLKSHPYPPPFIPLYLPLPPHGNHHTVVSVHEFFLFKFVFYSIPPPSPHQPPPSWQLAMLMPEKQFLCFVDGAGVSYTRQDKLIATMCFLSVCMSVQLPLTFGIILY